MVKERKDGIQDTAGGRHGGAVLRAVLRLDTDEACLSALFDFARTQSSKWFVPPSSVVELGVFVRKHPTLMMCYQGQNSKSESRNPKQIQNSKRQFSNAEAHPLSGLCLFALLFCRQKRAKRQSPLDRQADVPRSFGICRFDHCRLFRISDFVLRISDFLTAEISILIKGTLH